MKKMDEIMELLTEEIDGFNRSISKLEEFSKRLENLKVKTDSSNIEFYIRGFLKQQEKVMSINGGRVGEINQKITSATITPKWLTALFLVTLTVTILTFGYFGYHFIQFEENNKKAFFQGREEGISELRGYFDDHPIIYKDFIRWSQKKESLLKQE